MFRYFCLLMVFHFINLLIISASQLDLSICEKEHDRLYRYRFSVMFSLGFMNYLELIKLSMILHWFEIYRMLSLQLEEETLKLFLSQMIGNWSRELAEYINWPILWLDIFISICELGLRDLLRYSASFLSFYILFDDVAALILDDGPLRCSQVAIQWLSLS